MPCPRASARVNGPPGDPVAVVHLLEHDPGADDQVFPGSVVGDGLARVGVERLDQHASTVPREIRSHEALRRRRGRARPATRYAAAGRSLTTFRYYAAEAM
jgi:hypothetical protein